MTNSLAQIDEEPYSTGRESSLRKRFDQLDVHSNNLSSHHNSLSKNDTPSVYKHTGLTPMLERVDLQLDSDSDQLNEHVDTMQSNLNDVSRRLNVMFDAVDDNDQADV